MILDLNNTGRQQRYIPDVQSFNFVELNRGSLGEVISNPLVGPREIAGAGYYRYQIKALPKAPQGGWFSSQKSLDGLGSAVDPVVHQYCQGSEPSAATIAAIAAMGDTYQVIPCDYSVGVVTGGVTGSAPPGTAPVTAGPGGPQPAQNLPPEPQYQDCTQYGLASSAAAACVARNTAAQVAWQLAYIQAQQNYNIAMCEYNGNPASYCQQIFPPGMDTATTTPVALPTGGTQSAGGGTFVFADSSTGQSSPSRVNVGDNWAIAIRGFAPNSPVTVVITGPNGSQTLNAGSTDYTGTFLGSGQWAAADAGNWTEVWSVGGTVVATIQFAVIGAGGAVPTPPTNQQQAASQQTGKSNQSVPPSPQPGTVPAQTGFPVTQPQTTYPPSGGGVPVTTPATTTSFLSGSTAGIPNELLIGGGAFLLLMLTIMMGGRR